MMHWFVYYDMVYLMAMMYQQPTLGSEKESNVPKSGEREPIAWRRESRVVLRPDEDS